MGRSSMVLLACALVACDHANGSGAAPDASGINATAAADAATAGSDAAAAPDVPSSSSAYIVPAGPSTPETTYPLANVQTEMKDGMLRVDYNMPALLVGGDQQVSLRGAVDATGRTAIVSGDAGTATCDLMPGGGLLLRCNEMLTGIEVDLDGVQRIAQATVPADAAMYEAVASRFSGEPIGILEVR